MIFIFFGFVWLLEKIDLFNKRHLKFFGVVFFLDRNSVTNYMVCLILERWWWRTTVPTYMMISSPWAGEEDRLHPPIKHLNQRFYNNLHSIFTTLKIMGSQDWWFGDPRSLRNTESKLVGWSKDSWGTIICFHVGDLDGWHFTAEWFF